MAAKRAKKGGKGKAGSKARTLNLRFSPKQIKKALGAAPDFSDRNVRSETRRKIKRGIRDKFTRAFQRGG